MFNKYKKFVEMGLWTKEMVENVYKKGAITEEQYNELIEILG